MPVTYRDLFITFGRIGLLSFGGPAAQIALMQEELVVKKRWLDTDTFLRALSFCMLLPGPEAMQLATYAGWRLRGIWGGLLAGGLFVLPGAGIIFALAALYLRYGTLPLVQAAFLGIQATVIVVVVQALLRLSQKALGGLPDWAVAAMSFLGIFVVGLAFPVILILAAAFGAARASAHQSNVAPAPLTPTRPLVLFFWLVAWLAPIPVFWLSGADFLFDVAMLFAKLAVVTFGGAYSVLAYMTQQVVSDFGWLSTDQMIDALGLAETTPGPLILVSQFVGTVAGAAEGGPWLGFLAGFVTLWVTFVPCFLWIFAGAPYLERLTSNARLAAALKGITAAVVGVILNLSIWFALHVLFDELRYAAFIWAELPVPVISTINWHACALLAAAAFLLLVRKVPLPATLLITAALGVLLNLMAPGA
ncbi:MAG: chromate efflux transporter [Pseudomonadota bacterium]